MKRELTGADVKTICAHLEQKYGFKVYKKSESDGMRVIGSILEALHIVGKQEFMNNFCTTILDTVYLNFSPGESLDEYPPLDQLGVLVHEATHVVQYKATPFPFVSGYLMRSSMRASIEAEAYAAQSTIIHECAGTLVPDDFVREALTHYGCNNEDIVLAGQIVSTSNSAIERGAQVGLVAQETIRFMRELGVL